MNAALARAHAPADSLLVAEIFGPGTPLQEIVEWLRKRFPDSAQVGASE